MAENTTQTFTIPGLMPGMNEIIAANRGQFGPHIYGKMKSKWEAIIYAAILQYRIKPVEKALIGFEWIERNRKRDPDNINSGGRKFILDTLVKSGILKDDGWKNIVGFKDTYGIDKKNPRIIVAITEMQREAMK